MTATACFDAMLTTYKQLCCTDVPMLSATITAGLPSLNKAPARVLTSLVRLYFWASAPARL